MSGRGDNNKSGSSGRGASNQSNQPFGSSHQKGKSNHNKMDDTGKPSQTQSKQKDQYANRNRSVDGDRS